MMPMPWGRSMRAAYGKVIIGNIIPVMVLSPLSIMLLRMEGMGSGGEGLDVEGEMATVAQPSWWRRMRMRAVGVGGVYGVVGG